MMKDDVCARDCKNYDGSIKYGMSETLEKIQDELRQLIKFAKNRGMPPDVLSILLSRTTGYTLETLPLSKISGYTGLVSRFTANPIEHLKVIDPVLYAGAKLYESDPDKFHEKYPKAKGFLKAMGIHEPEDTEQGKETEESDMSYFDEF